MGRSICIGEFVSINAMALASYSILSPMGRDRIKKIPRMGYEGFYRKHGPDICYGSVIPKGEYPCVRNFTRQ